MIIVFIEVNSWPVQSMKYNIYKKNRVQSLKNNMYNKTQYNKSEEITSDILPYSYDKSRWVFVVNMSQHFNRYVG